MFATRYRGKNRPCRLSSCIFFNAVFLCDQEISISRHIIWISTVEGFYERSCNGRRFASKTASSCEPPKRSRKTTDEETRRQSHKHATSFFQNRYNKRYAKRHGNYCNKFILGTPAWNLSKSNYFGKIFPKNSISIICVPNCCWWFEIHAWPSSMGPQISNIHTQPWNQLSHGITDAWIG